jgi:hypothetical protein
MNALSVVVRWGLAALVLTALATALFYRRSTRAVASAVTGHVLADRTSSSRAIDSRVGRVEDVPIPSDVPASYKAPFLTLPADTLAPRAKAAWILGAPRLVIQELQRALGGGGVDSCIFAEGRVSSVDDFRLRIRVEGKPPRSLLESYARQRGREVQYVLMDPVDVRALTVSQTPPPCARWRAGEVEASDSIVLRVGTSRAFHAPDVVRAARTEGTSARLVREPLSGSWRLEGIHIGLTRLRIERLPGPREESIRVEVVPRDVRGGRRGGRSPSMGARERGRTRQERGTISAPSEVFVVPGWSGPQRADKQ